MVEMHGDEGAKHGPLPVYIGFLLLEMCICRMTAFRHFFIIMEIEVGVCGCIMDRELSTEACMGLQMEKRCDLWTSLSCLMRDFISSFGHIILLPVMDHQWSLL